MRTYHRLVTEIMHTTSHNICCFLEVSTRFSHSSNARIMTKMLVVYDPMVVHVSLWLIVVAETRSVMISSYGCADLCVFVEKDSAYQGHVIGSAAMVYDNAQPPF